MKIWVVFSGDEDDKIIDILSAHTTEEKAMQALKELRADRSLWSGLVNYDFETLDLD